MQLFRFGFALLVLHLLFAPLSPLSAQDCSGKLADGDRKRCEDLFARRVQSASQISQLAGGWRLVKTPDPRGGASIVSVLHVADTGKSDANFAGLTFRCGPVGIETLLILVDPLPRRTRYRIRIKSPSPETEFEATTLQAGEVLLLPPSATALAAGPWQSAPELSIEIEARSTIHGAVPLQGLSGALSLLSQNCPMQ